MNSIEEILKDDRCWTVYVHTNMVNGKMYVGITSESVNRRWRNGKGYKAGVFKNAIQKYGWDGFEHEVVSENLTESEAKAFEITLIRELDTHVDNRNGYNCTEGGDGCKLSKEARLKISIANTGRIKLQEELDYRSEIMSNGGNPSAIGVICENVEYGSINECAEFYGVNKDSMRMWLRGTRAMPERFINMGLNYVDKNIRIGEFKIQKKHGGRSRKVICLNTGEVFETILFAKEKYNAFNIAVCCKGKVKTAGKHPQTGEPLSWMYYEDYIKFNKESEVIKYAV